MSRLVSKLPVRILLAVLAGMLAIGGCTAPAATGGPSSPPSEPAASGGNVVPAILFALLLMAAVALGLYTLARPFFPL